MKVVITGITGTLGQKLLQRALKDTRVKEIVGISRDEQKQRALAGEKRLQLVLGDVRDKWQMVDVMDGADVVYHTAALKCVDSLERSPWQAHLTNIEGTKNVVDACKGGKVRRLVFTSTDKAVSPINVYGMSKGVAEYLVRDAGYTVVRYGNVLGSRGSVISAFINTLRYGKKVKITDPAMTRYWIKADFAADFVYGAPERKPGEVHFPPMKSAGISLVAEAVARCLDMTDYKIDVVGIRPGEKIHELISNSGKASDSSQTAPKFTVPELEDLVGPIVREILANE